MFNLEPINDVLFEAVELEAFKTHARIFTSVDDDYCTGLLVSAREQAEKDIEIAIVGQEYKLHLDHWLDLHYIERYFYGQYSRFPFYFQGPHIVLPITPIQSVSSIQYTDPDAVLQTWDPSNYRLRTHKDPVDIQLLTSYPAIKDHTDILVDFTAGYANANAVPGLVKQAVMFLAAHWYEHRVAVADTNTFSVPIGYERVVNRLRVKRFR